VISFLLRQLRWFVRLPYLPEMVSIDCALFIAFWSKSEPLIRLMGTTLLACATASCSGTTCAPTRWRGGCSFLLRRDVVGCRP